MELSKVCRLCLINTEVINSLYDQYTSTMCVGEVFMSITSLSSLEYYNYEGVPTKICRDCFYELERCYKFVLKCRESDTKLRNYLNTIRKTKENRNNLANKSDVLLIQNDELRGDIKTEVPNSDTTLGTNELPILPENVISLEPVNDCSDIYEHYRTDIQTNMDKELDLVKNEIEFDAKSGTKHLNYKNQMIPPVNYFNSNTIINKSSNFHTHVGGLEKIEETGVNPTYLCKICDKLFPEKTILNLHMRTHARDKPYACTLCDKTFTLKSNLTSHIRAHTGEKPYSCELCGKCFAHKSYYCHHKRTHSGEKPHTCYICNKSFNAKATLTRHITAMHQDIRQVSNNSAQQQSQCMMPVANMLVKHSTRAKPYACIFCEKSFTCQVNLTHHMRTHTGEKPYSCSICGKCFTHPSYLCHHMQTHTSAKKFACTVCNRSFNAKSSLIRHIQTLHETHK